MCLLNALMLQLCQLIFESLASQLADCLGWGRTACKAHSRADTPWHVPAWRSRGCGWGSSPRNKLWKHSLHAVQKLVHAGCSWAVF